MNLQDIAKAIGNIDADPALCAALKAQLAAAAPNFVAQFSRRVRRETPFPAAGTITAAQVSLFDNWIEFGGKRPKRGEDGHYRDRFKLTFDLWTTPSASLDLKSTPAFSGTVHLWSGAEIVKRGKARKGSLKLPKALSDPFREFVLEAGAQMGPEDRLGLIYTHLGPRIAYYDGLCVIADARDFERRDGVKIVIRAPNDHHVAITDFSKTTSKGARLPGNCFGHARLVASKKLAEEWNATYIEKNL